MSMCVAMWRWLLWCIWLSAVRGLLCGRVGLRLSLMHVCMHGGLMMLQCVWLQLVQWG